MTVPTQTSVGASASAVQLLAPNPNRVKAPDLGAEIVNDSGATLYIGPDNSVTSSKYTVALGPAGTFPGSEEFVSTYTGAWWGIWSSATGNARVTEFA